MAYNLHIFRGTDWTDGADDPITADELLSIDGVEKFSQPPITNPRTGLSMSMGMDNMYSYGIDDDKPNDCCLISTISKEDNSRLFESFTFVSWILD